MVSSDIVTFSATSNLRRQTGLVRRFDGKLIVSESYERLSSLSVLASEASRARLAPTPPSGQSDQIAPRNSSLNTVKRKPDVCWSTL